MSKSTKYNAFCLIVIVVVFVAVLSTIKFPKKEPIETVPSNTPAPTYTPVPTSTPVPTEIPTPTIPVEDKFFIEAPNDETVGLIALEYFGMNIDEIVAVYVNDITLILGKIDGYWRIVRICYG